MAGRPLWTPLAVPDNLPPLLISSNFKPTAYTVYLTDLTNVWSESLNLRDIKMRSLEEGTSIDPTVGDEQLRIFMEKLELGAGGGENTTAELNIKSDAERPKIIVKVKIILPEGLDPLEWPFHLRPATPTTIASHLVVPLLRTQHTRNEEFGRLIEVVREKDLVIQKLLDKFEAQGVELGQVFAQAATKGGRKVSREKAAERVKGLGIFDIEAWRSGEDLEVPQDTRHLIGEIFKRGDATQSGITPVDAALSDDEEKWWEAVKGKTITLLNGSMEHIRPSSPDTSKQAAKGTPKVVSKAEETLEDEDDDDDFQVQSTPPQVASSAGTAVPKTTDDSSTDDEDDDLDAPTQNSKVPDSFPRVTPPSIPTPKKKLGALGGRKKEPSPEPTNDDTTDDEEPTLLPKRHHPKSPTPTPSPSPPPKKKGRLGKLGGKKEPPKEPTPPPVEESSSPEPEPKQKKGKLGRLGGRKKEDTPPPADASSDTEKDIAPVKKKLGRLGGGRKSPAREKTPAKDIPQEEKEDTPPDERADKKRLQLKRELEAKTKAGPAKKKRKF